MPDGPMMGRRAGRHANGRVSMAAKIGYDNARHAQVAMTVIDAGPQ